MVAQESVQINSNGKRVTHRSKWPEWHQELAAFRNSDARKAVWQLVNTLVPYAALWYLMIRTIQLGYPYALTLALALPASAFLVRLYILFHDCVHDSFFKSKKINTFVGYCLGVLVFTSFEDWRFSHLRHHSTYANLDARGFGDIWTLTLQEYQASSKWTRLMYRLYRNPLILVGLGAIFNFLLYNRLPTRQVKRKEWMSVLFTNLLLIAVVLIAARFIGWRTYLLIQLPLLWLAGAAGIWMFYVQHQFAGGYWARKGEWDPLRAAMEGSSFYRLPAVARWFTGSIGFHHVHHLGPRIPNYQLKKCYDTIPGLQAKAPVTFWKSLSFYRLKVWDEEQGAMVPFS